MTFARPKSRILTWNFPLGSQMTMKFCGLMSRWTMPAECAAIMPSRTVRDKLAKIVFGQRAAFDDILERLALEQLHDDVGALLVAAHVINGDDVRMLERGEVARLVHELLGLPFRLLGRLRAHALERDFTPQVAVVGLEDGAESAVGDLAEDFVAVLAHACPPVERGLVRRPRMLPDAFEKPFEGPLERVGPG